MKYRIDKTIDHTLQVMTKTNTPCMRGFWLDCLRQKPLLKANYFIQHGNFLLL